MSWRQWTSCHYLHLNVGFTVGIRVHHDSTSAGKELPVIMHRSNNEEGTFPVVGIRGHG